MVSHTLTVTIQDNMGVSTEQTEEAVSLALRGNYPNPLSNSTKIAFDLPEPAQIQSPSRIYWGGPSKRCPTNRSVRAWGIL